MILGKFFKKCELSSTDFYIVLSSNIFKAEIKEFEAILCWPEHVKRDGLGHLQLNKLDKLHSLPFPWMLWMIQIAFFFFI